MNLKKILVGKVIALVFLLVVGGIVYFYSQQGKIGFLSWKEEKQEIKDVVVEMPINENQYQLSYKDIPNTVFDIANFENSESWFGDGIFDFSTYFEGESSLFLTSINHQEASVKLKQTFNIEEILFFKFFVYLATDPAYVEEFNLIFSSNNQEYKFQIRDFEIGWNLFTIPKEKFFSVLTENEERGKTILETKIEEITIELVSRPNVRCSVNLDSLWAEGKNNYLKDWNLNTDNFLALRKNGNYTNLLAINLTDNRATLRKGSGKDYTVRAKFTPLKKGAFGYFLRGDYKSGYGYYLVMNGAETTNWQISKYGSFEGITQNIVLTKGEISNFNLSVSRTYWLKAILEKHRVIFLFSQDGKKFTILGEVDDKSFSSGGVGIFVSGGNMVFIDDLLYSQ